MQEKERLNVSTIAVNSNNKDVLYLFHFLFKTTTEMNNNYKIQIGKFPTPEKNPKHLANRLRL